jgi:Transcriptional regulatory protein, C terminal
LEFRFTDCDINIAREWLSRAAWTVNLQFLFADLSLDTDRRELRRGSEPIAVEPQVFDLLIYLWENRDRVVSKDELLASVWAGRIVSDATLTSRTYAARKALGDSGRDQKRVADSGIVHPRFVADRAHNNRTGIDPDAHGKLFATGPMACLRAASACWMRRRVCVDLHTRAVVTLLGRKISKGRVGVASSRAREGLRAAFVALEKS